MMVSYDGIVFDILQLKEWKREAVYTEDKTTFLFWYHTLNVTTLLNDEATNAQRFPTLTKNKVGLVGTTAKATAKATGGLSPLRHGPLPWREDVQRRTDLDFIPFLEREELFNPLSPLNLKDAPDGFAGISVGAPGQEVGRAAINAVPPKIVTPRTTQVGGRRVVTLAGLTTPSSRTPDPSRTRHTVPLTDNELRTRLACPRRELAVWLYTGKGGTPEYLLRQPHLNATVDAQTGPICTTLDGTSIHGQMTEVMDLRFETWEAPAIEFETVPGESSSVDKDTILRGAGIRQPGGKLTVDMGRRPARVRIKTPAVLSHRWQMAFGWNPETHLRTQTIEGEVIFRSDVLHLRGLSADQLRPYFMAHRIPAGYVRKPAVEGDVQLDAAGHGVKYKITDVQQMTNFPGGVDWGVIELEADTKYMRNGWDGEYLK